MITRYLVLFISASGLLGISSLTAITTRLEQQSEDRTQVRIGVTFEPGEALFKDSLSFGTSDPELAISNWTSSAQPHSLFDRVTEQPKLAYKEPLTLTVTFNKPVLDATTLFMHFMTNSRKFPQERQFNFSTPQVSVTDTAETETIEQQSPSHAPEGTTADLPPVPTPSPQSIPQLLYEGLHSALNTLFATLRSAAARVSSLLTTTTSRPVQFLLAFLLGILMSLTPCIYPMIPITVGLLGVSSGQSILRNFILALSYTIGLATVFALLGLSAVFFGAQFGNLLAHPFVIGLLVFFLAYCGGSMFGWYELYIPRWLTPHNSHNRQGSLLSAFLFGAASGLIASPCMSPGLALILSMVAVVGNLALGFLLLFTFGIGSSMPLLLIGTFSGSLHLLPRSGIWMNEVKKFFGFMLFMVCFYYLQSILPLAVVMGTAGFFSFGAGLIYSTNLLRARTALGKGLILAISFLLMTVGIYEGYIAIMSWKQIGITPHHDGWLSSYAEARKRAQVEGKLLLVDFGANWCSLCVMLEKKILHNAALAPLLEKVVAIKVDGSSADNEEYNTLVQQFKIYGIPALFLIDPTTEEIIYRWNSALLERTAEEFNHEALGVVAEREQKK